MIFISLISLFSSIFFDSSTSNTMSINFKPILNNHQLILEKTTTDNITITNFKFYITNIALLNKKEIVWKEPNSYHLIDATIKSSQNIEFNLPENIEFDELFFLLGIDSLTNVSGVMGGDLDPTKGMYWAWNSGYINFKLEGKKNDKPFEFHLGGYSPPTSQKITFFTNNHNLIVDVNINDFLNNINLTETSKLMSPGRKAQQLSIKASKIFKLNE